ncbi:MAG: amidohydrolase family protein [Armatimonadota bacterium]
MKRTDNDAIVYEEKIAPWLPERIVDCHVHVGLPDFVGPISPERSEAIWAMEISNSQSWSELRANLELLFPGKDVWSLAFGWVYREVDIKASNDYVLSGISDPANRARGLFVTRPEWDAGIIEEALNCGFRGIKPYPDLAPQGQECSIFDFLPHSHLRVLDKAGSLLMLHLPRRGRVADPQNIRELREIADKYPRVKIIVAHIGRAYCLPTAQRGLPQLADANLYFDTAANLNSDVFRLALDIFGPERILYGSDLPIMMMRGFREHVGETYINYTNGNYSWNKNRKDPAEEARYTFYLYEELLALIDAVRSMGMGQREFHMIINSNGTKLLGLTT